MKNLGAEHENLDQKAYEIVKHMITERQFLPGEKIPQEKLAQELGISRTPLVSALKFLEHEKLVESKPRRGYFVRLFSKQEMVSIFELREVLEGLAAKRAAANITDKQIEILNGFFKPFIESTNITDFRAYAKEDRHFHNFITEIGAKEFLKSILQTCNIITASYQYLSTEGLVRPPNETIEEHLAVIKAIRERNPDTAEILMRRHLRKTIAHLKQDIEKETQGSDSHKIIRPSF
ncbi:MAG: GntR family transcriptional regulator [Deltaproteobacteria bacterium]|jgi:DNA-binding GntR family transcriptional regulator|nr:GntR family transcriptional regulator [Deltaproteobacteria bacterium]MBW2489123.1 GntR family transcriptional regulator [Deltaproteobacteria bacterium]MBW2516276.1 GntR family transcriptional regulator [Deltaproteobacteria bacterium]